MMLGCIMTKKNKLVLLMGILGFWQSAAASVYTETYNVAPPSGQLDYLLSSPNGLTYDLYPGRALTRLAPYPVDVIGNGDEGFIWGNNSLLPGPAYGLPGNTYSSLSGDFLLNAYGSGVLGYTLGINFTNGPTEIFSMEFGTANGSNAPTTSVQVEGLLNGSVQWTVSTNITGNVTLNTPSTSVNELLFFQQGNSVPQFSNLPVAWYTITNLTYEIPTVIGPVGGGIGGGGGIVNGGGGYTWSSAPVILDIIPEPEEWAMIILGLPLLMWGVRKKNDVLILA